MPSITILHITQLIATVMLVCRSWMFACTITHPSVLMASETQQFAWCGHDVEPLRRARDCCDAEPMFCFETALRAMFWTVAAYRETHTDLRAEEQVFTIANGKRVDQLDHHQVMIWEEHDIAMICTYGPGLIIMSFRGTVSLKKYAVYRCQTWCLETSHPCVQWICTYHAIIPPNTASIWMQLRGKRGTIHRAVIEVFGGAPVCIQALPKHGVFASRRFWMYCSMHLLTAARTAQRMCMFC